MDTPQPAETPPPARPDAEQAADASPLAAAPRLVLLGDTGAPACTDGACR